MPTYDPRLSLAEAVKQYFIDNKFGADGGYGVKWVHVKLGPLPFVVPNSKERVRAIRFHDLHHVLTGYSTDLAGEFEIGAWELATWCGDFTVAWILNLQSLIAGFLVYPKRTFAAFARGRATKNLYGEPYTPELLQESVGAAMKRLGLDAPPKTRLGVKDWLALAGYTALGIPVGIVGLVTGIALVPVAAVQMALASRQAATVN